MLEIKNDERLDGIERKLDLIYEELAAAKRERQEIKELKDDLTVIAKDIFKTAAEELDDIAPFVDTGDFLHLLKKILRNINTISNTISKFESAIDFVKDAGPIGDEIFRDTLLKFDELDRKGYFKLGREVGRAVDSTVECMSPDEMKDTAASLVSAFCLFKEVAGTDLIPSLERSVREIKNADPSRAEKMSLFKILKELNSPEIKRVMGTMIIFLKTLANETKANGR